MTRTNKSLQLTSETLRVRSHIYMHMQQLSPQETTTRNS